MSNRRAAEEKSKEWKIRAVRERIFMFLGIASSVYQNRARPEGKSAERGRGGLPLGAGFNVRDSIFSRCGGSVVQD
jgi:hypothetical protein